MRQQRKSAAIDAAFRPRTEPSVLYRELRTGCLLYHPGTNEAHALNLAAAYVWNCCDGHTDVAGLAAHVAEACRLPYTDALRDVQAALADFRARRLLA